MTPGKSTSWKRQRHSGEEAFFFSFLTKDMEEFEYDADGNLLKDERFEYTWDGENRLDKVETRSDLLSWFPGAKWSSCLITLAGGGLLAVTLHGGTAD